MRFECRAGVVKIPEKTCPKHVYMQMEVKSEDLLLFGHHHLLGYLRNGQGWPARWYGGTAGMYEYTLALNAKCCRTDQK